MTPGEIMSKMVTCQDEKKRQELSKKFNNATKEYFESKGIAVTISEDSKKNKE
jgi:hypothetical protein